MYEMPEAKGLRLLIYIGKAHFNYMKIEKQRYCL